jgi:hypothetical protein
VYRIKKPENGQGPKGCRAIEIEKKVTYLPFSLNDKLVNFTIKPAVGYGSRIGPVIFPF